MRCIVTGVLKVSEYYLDVIPAVSALFNIDISRCKRQRWDISNRRLYVLVELFYEKILIIVL